MLLFYLDVLSEQKFFLTYIIVVLNENSGKEVL